MKRLLAGIAMAAFALGVAGCAATTEQASESAAAQPAQRQSAQVAQAPQPASPPPHMPKDLAPDTVKAADEFLWLEDVNGKKSLDWVKEQNAKTDAVLKADPRYEAFRKEALAILTAQDRTPEPTFRGDGVDNFWQDGKQVRGLWRHTTLESYQSDKPKWQTVLDIDALAKREKANWIYKGVDCLPPEET
ncbi:MAG TPA: S9 family peptidase, partial [Hyphomonadaceae bacterium]|nr:S9 family peptidase [Hyphomonadaceae bacterium]